MKKILFLLLITLTLTGCQEKLTSKTPSEIFIEQNSNMGIYIDGRQTLIFDENIHQLCIADDEFRIQTDAQDQFVNFKVGVMPTQVDKSISVIITSRGIKGVSDGPYMMTIKKIEDQTIWLWSESKKIGVVMPIAQ